MVGHLVRELPHKKLVAVVVAVVVVGQREERRCRSHHGKGRLYVYTCTVCVYMHVQYVYTCMYSMCIHACTVIILNTLP